MPRYQTVTTVGDMGPWVERLILELPEPIRAHDVCPAAFNVYVERRDPATGEVVHAKEHHDDAALPSRGFVPVRRAFVSDASGNPIEEGDYVTLTLPERRLTKRIDGAMTKGFLRQSVFRVTQLQELPPHVPGGAPLAGLVWDEDAGDVCPQLEGWDLGGSGRYDGIEMRYATFSPRSNGAGKVPLVLWLHGAGEGGEPYRTVTGNKVVALGEADIQRKLGGAASVLAPSCPTFWMDSGSGGIEDDNQSIYTHALKNLVDEFVATHAATVDRRRIYVGGLSNGGFMACRLIADYPGFFAAGVPVCAPWNDALATGQELASLARTPLWFVHADDDPLVRADATALPTYWHLRAMGNEDVHLTYYNHIEDETGAYHDEDGRPTRYSGHFAWIDVYHDGPKTDIDGTNVLLDGRPVTLWQWVGGHALHDGA